MAAQVAETQVAGDDEEPAPGLFITHISDTVAYEAQKRFLGRVLGRLWLSEHAESKAVEALVMALETALVIQVAVPCPVSSLRARSSCLLLL